MRREASDTHATEDLDLAYELQPDGTTDNLSVPLRRSIGLVRLGGVTATTAICGLRGARRSIACYPTRAAFAHGARACQARPQGRLGIEKRPVVSVGHADRNMLFNPHPLSQGSGPCLSLSLGVL